MQLLKWFCSKNYLRLIFLVLVVCLAIPKANAQYKKIEYKVAKKETLYKISVLYSTEVDSLMKWNDLSTDLISEGQIITLIDYYDLQKEELELNRRIYALESVETQVIERTAYFNAKLDSIQEAKNTIDDNGSKAMQQLFELAKWKKRYQDSIEVSKENSIKEIENLRNDIEKAKGTVAKKYKKKYTSEGDLILRKANPKKNESSVNVIKENEELAANESYAKQKEEELKETIAIEKLRKIEEEEKEKKNLEEEAALEAKKEADKLAKELADLEKANKIAAKKQIAEAKKQEKILLKMAADKAKAEKEKAEKEKAEINAKLKKELEAQKLEQEKLKLQAKEEQAKLAEQEAKKAKEQEAEMTPMEMELAAMAKAKKLALEKKEKEAQEKLEKEAEKEEKKEKNKAVKDIQKENEDDVLVFDVEFKAETDTSSRKYKKQQAALAKELEEIESKNKGMTTVKVEQVEVKSTKKNKKLKLGDDVDVMRMEKSRFFLSRAKVEIDKKNFKKAVEYTDKSIGLNPNNLEAYMIKGDILASFEYYDKAYSSYEKANQVDPSIPQLHYNMGNCLILTGKKEKAIQEMGVAIALDSTYILAYQGRSSLFLELNKFRSALHDYNTILEINKYFYPALKGRGIANLNLGNYNEAIRDFNALLEYDAKDPSVYYQRGMAKMYKAEIYGACMDFLSSSEMGFSEADRAIKKYCD